MDDARVAHADERVRSPIRTQGASPGDELWGWGGEAAEAEVRRNRRLERKRRWEQQQAGLAAQQQHP